MKTLLIAILTWSLTMFATTSFAQQKQKLDPNKAIEYTMPGKKNQKISFLLSEVTFIGPYVVIVRNIGKLPVPPEIYDQVYAKVRPYLNPEQITNKEVIKPEGK